MRRRKPALARSRWNRTNYTDPNYESKEARRDGGNSDGSAGRATAVDPRVYANEDKSTSMLQKDKRLQPVIFPALFLFTLKRIGGNIYLYELYYYNVIADKVDRLKSINLATEIKRIFIIMI